MSRNIGISAGLAVGILIGLIIAILLVRMANTNKKYKTEYDERQLRVRGDAYRYAFYTIVIYEAILAILAVGEITLPIQGYLLHFAGILLGCLVLSGYSIWKVGDKYYPMLRVIDGWKSGYHYIDYEAFAKDISQSVFGSFNTIEIKDR